MSDAYLADLAREALVVVLTLATPVLLVGLVTAAVVGLVQAATGVQEYTIGLVPKILAMLLSILLLGSWIGGRMTDFAVRMYTTLP